MKTAELGVRESERRFKVACEAEICWTKPPAGVGLWLTAIARSRTHEDARRSSRIAFWKTTRTVFVRSVPRRRRSEMP